MIKKMVATMMIVTAVMYITGAWLVGSVLTSVVKAATNNCGETYVVEKVLKGNWFCKE